MRGWVSLLGKDRGTERYSTGLFVASAEPTLVSTIVRHVRERFPNVTFTCLAPQSYNETISIQEETLWFEEMKKTPLHSLIELRSRRFDICVAILAGGPSFRKWKIAAFFLNVRRMFIYNENFGCFPADRAHLSSFFRHLAARCKPWPSSALLFVPIGFSYLFARTVWMICAARLRRTSNPAVDMDVPQPEARK
jgi:hypothetical protein